MLCTAPRGFRGIPVPPVTVSSGTIALERHQAVAYILSIQYQMTDGSYFNMHAIAESIVQVAQQRHQAECQQSSCQIDVQFSTSEAFQGIPLVEYRITATPTKYNIIMEFQKLPLHATGEIVYALPRSDKQQFQDGVDTIVQHIVDDLDWTSQEDPGTLEPVDSITITGRQHS